MSNMIYCWQLIDQIREPQVLNVLHTRNVYWNSLHGGIFDNSSNMPGRMKL